MRYRPEIKEEARRQLRALGKEQRRNIGRRLDALQNNLSDDVRKLTAKTQEYRLRVGTLRVLFTLEKDLIRGVCCERSQGSLWVTLSL